MDNCIVRYIDLPVSIPAVTEIDTEGDYNIYINAMLSDDEKKNALLHELQHVKRGHFYKDVPISFCETEANNG